MMMCVCVQTSGPPLLSVQGLRHPCLVNTGAVQGTVPQTPLPHPLILGAGNMQWTMTTLLIGFGVMSDGTMCGVQAWVFVETTLVYVRDNHGIQMLTRGTWLRLRLSV